MSEHLLLTILLQIKDAYHNFVSEERILYAPPLDDNILEYSPFNDGFIDARLLRDENLADTFDDLINTYKNYYKIYKETISR